MIKLSKLPIRSIRQDVRTGKRTDPDHQKKPSFLKKVFIMSNKLFLRYHLTLYNT